MDPNQIILQLAAEIRDVLFPFEVREEPVEEKEPSFLPGTGQPRLAR